MMRLAGYIGRFVIHATNHLMTLFAFTCKLCGYFIRRPVFGGALMRRFVIESIYESGVKLLPILIPIAFIIGTTMIVQFAKLSGQYEIGKMSVLIIVRELGPVITALLIILRSATSVTIEMAYMNRFHEIEALEMGGMDPMWVVCFPRLIGITGSMIAMFIVFDLVSILGGYFVAWMVTYIPLSGFMEQVGKAISGTDIAVGIVKAIFFGVTIAVTCLFRGFSGSIRMTDISVRTSQAAIECFFYCIVINVGISTLFYM